MVAQYKIHIKKGLAWLVSSQRFSHKSVKLIWDQEDQKDFGLLSFIFPEQKSLLFYFHKTMLSESQVTRTKPQFSCSHVLNICGKNDVILLEYWKAWK